MDPAGLRAEKPWVMSELFVTTVEGSFCACAVIVASLVTVSEVVTAPTGYLTVIVEVMGFCHAQSSYVQVTVCVAAS